ncbi:efflux RND transporter periplasmic adaptor subunit [Burkholderia ubonensis]|uniref:Efflux transporter periplasmic adaptor subunit n=1 Tax=Burkholderia ubonensis subsp. mesacidophila TaxID=265293 RepID=A0A2A4EM37_9BURK|nr:efflux RND transporter periplasmic adaptor subunit [Burkholderia ubonensis]PCE21667.1 efflux transporter periplasmic adaptor subunit [Burkholderia ubonensis subsp. mesacidophila]
MPPKRKYPIAIAVLLIVAAAGAVTAVLGRGGAIKPVYAEAQPPAAEVDVAAAVEKRIVDWQSYSGRLEAIDKVEVRPLVSGTIVAVHFKDGALVKKGDPLFTIDPRPYVVEVDRAEARLASAQARRSFTDADLARARRLIVDNAIAKRDFDEKQNASREADADLKAAQAALEAARLNLGYTRIVAPVAGRVSRAEMTVGNIVFPGASSQPLTTLVSLSPIYASFDVDEQTYLAYLSRNGKGAMPVMLGLADEGGYSHPGSVSSIDNRIDSGSGTVRVRAIFDNPDGTLLPGLFARVKISGSTLHPAVLISDGAIGTDQEKKFVMVVDAQNRVQYREILPGHLQDGLRIVSRGLQPGERIVVNGLQRIRPGSSVKPNLVSMAADSVSG